MTKLTHFFALASTRLSTTVQVYQANMYTSHGRRYFANSTRLFMHKNNGFNNNSNNESGRSNVYKFLSRITISMIGGITVKSLFLSWYNDNFSWIGLVDNIYSLHSGLMAIGILAGGLINKLLDFTPLNINIKNFLVDPSLKRLKQLFLSWKEARALVLNQDRIPGQGQAGQPGGTSSSGSKVQSNDGASSSTVKRTYRPHRSPSEIAEARNNWKLSHPQWPGESVEKYNKRIRTSEASHYGRKINTKHTVHRSPEMIKKSQELTKAMLHPRPGESEEDFNERVKRTEVSHYVRINQYKHSYRTEVERAADREKVSQELERRDGETDEMFNKRVNKRDYYLQNKKNRTNLYTGIGGARKISTFSNSTKHSFSNGKLRICLYRPTSYPRAGDKDFGKTSFKSYSTYSRNLILPSARLKDDDGASSKLNNKNIFLNRAIYNFIKASVNNQIYGVHFQDSTVLITFLEEFDSDFYISRQSIHNYKKRKLVFNGFLVNTDVSRFLAYVNSRFPEFNPSAFLQKYSGTCMPASA